MLSALDLLQPPERIATVDCAETYRLMPGKENGAVVRYDRMRTPYNVGPMNSLDNPKCQGIVMVKPSRSGGTAVAENYAFKLMKFGPMVHIAWVLNSDEAVTAYVRKVVKPMFDLNDLPVGKGRGDDTDTFKKVAGYPVEWLANKDSTWRDREPGYIQVDEPDAAAKRWAASPRVQLDGRQKQLGNRRKWSIMSHPDLGYRSGVGAAFEDTSRGIYVMTCPECGGHAAAYATKYWDDIPEFKLTWDRNDQLPADERVRRAAETAALSCPHCGVDLNDQQRRDMVDAALTRDDDSIDGWMHRGQQLDPKRGVIGEPAPHIAHGFWVHGTMLKTQDIAELARAYQQALIKFERTKDAAELKEFMSKQLGEIFEGAATTGGVSTRALKSRVEASGYDRGMVPPQVQFITAAIDVGKRAFDVVFIGWDLKGRSWLIDRLTIRQRVDENGVPRTINTYDRQEDWDLLWEQVLTRRFPLIAKPDHVMPVAVTLVDDGDGNATWKAREFARRVKRLGYNWSNGYSVFQRLVLIKGKDGKRPALPEAPRLVDKDQQGRAVEPALFEYTLGVDKLKEQTMERLAVAIEQRPHETNPDVKVDFAPPGFCHFPREMDQHYLDQFFGESLIDGKWVRNGPNETLDLYGYAEAGRQMLQPDREEIDWTGRRPIWATATPLREESKPAAAEQSAPSIFDAFAALNE